MPSSIKQRIEEFNWQQITESMNSKGYALLPNMITKEECDELIHDYNKPGAYRKTVVMERYRYGLGEYKYFNYPLPAIIQCIRENIYGSLSPIANGWMSALKIDKHFPATFAELQKLCHDNNQTKPTPLILKYGEGGHNTLHQDLYGDIFFPMQAVLFLNEPGIDYTGGEFVLTQQVPRAQSKVMVLTPRKGDMLLFTTSFRPGKGSNSYYRVNVKHGVSEVHSGTRHTLGIIFHDALT